MNHLRNAVWMRDRGHQVLVIGIANSPFLLKALKLNLPVQTVPKYRKYYAFFSAFNLYKLLRKENATHLFIRDTRDMSIMASLKFLFGKKIRAVYFMEMQLGVTKKKHLSFDTFLLFGFLELSSSRFGEASERKNQLPPRQNSNDSFWIRLIQTFIYFF